MQVRAFPVRFVTCTLLVVKRVATGSAQDFGLVEGLTLLDRAVQNVVVGSDDTMRGSTDIYCLDFDRLSVGLGCHSEKSLC